MSRITEIMNYIKLSHHMKFTVFLIAANFLIEGVKCISESQINNHLEMGRLLLSSGKLQDALTHYHAAVEADSKNYLTLFKRGTVYLALGKAKNALSDLDHVLELKPDFLAAKVSRGNVHLMLANYDLAQLDFYSVLQIDPTNMEANELIHRIQPAKDQKELAQQYFHGGDHMSGIRLISEVIDISPWSAELFEIRSQMYMETNDILSAVSDIKAATKLQADNTQGYFTLATLLYQLGHARDALRSIRECLKLDPEHKDCFPFYKKIKKVEKFLTQAEMSVEEGKFQDCISYATKALNGEKEVEMIVFESKRLLCKCLMKDEQLAEAITVCGEALELSKEADIYCDRAEAYVQSDLFDDAIYDYKAALELESHLDRAKEGIEKAKKLQQQAERRDYYKILDVKRTATKKDIIKAYRKQAQKWHPDNYQLDEKMKKIAEKKFIDIAAAKEVLTDEEKRKQFDNGEDPLDPEAGRNNMHNFHHFNQFQGGSPFQFRFHFQ